MIVFFPSLLNLVVALKLNVVDVEITPNTSTVCITDPPTFKQWAVCCTTDSQTSKCAFDNSGDYTVEVWAPQAGSASFSVDFSTIRRGNSGLSYRKRVQIPFALAQRVDFVLEAWPY